MFNKDLIKHLESRIKSLEEQNTKLLDQIIILSGKAAESLNMQQAAMPFEQPSYMDYITGEIRKIPAETEEERLQQEAAIKEAEQMFNTAGVM